MEPKEINSVVEKLLSCSATEDLEELQYEWEFMSFLSEPGHCICGQGVEKQFIIRNTQTQKELCLGKDCLEDLGNELLTDTAVIRRKEAKGSKRKLCGCCLKLTISSEAHPSSMKCRPCTESNQPVKQAYKNLYFRPCKECGERDIMPHTDSWRTLCTDCYAIKKTSSRECKQCGEKRIPPSARESEEICYPCKLAGGKKQCEVCGELNIFVSESWRKLCSDCWRKKQ